MWCEKMKERWGYVCYQISYLLEVNKADKKTKVPSPDELNPMTRQATTSTSSFKLNTEEGWLAMASVAQRWRQKQ